MMVSLLTYTLLMISFQLSSQQFSFSQPATGPSSVYEGSDVTLQCAVVFSFDNTTTVQDTVWSRNISGMITTITTQTPVPNHRVVFNSTNRAFTDLVITNVTLEDNNAVYSCSATGATIISSVVLNVTASTQATTTTPSPTISNQSSGTNTDTIRVIFLVVAGGTSAIFAIIFVISCRKVHTEGFNTRNERDENNYVQPNENAPQQEENNEEYAYAINGSRVVAFPSEMPQQQ